MNYDDIINLPHHVSKKHPHMSMIDRAAQFAPFMALVGYGDEVKEAQRLTDGKSELSEDEKLILNEKLVCIAENIAAKPEAEITWFIPDAKKEGGRYNSVRGSVKKIDAVYGTVTLTDGTVIAIDDIRAIEL